MLEPSSEDQIRCPNCAELIRRRAILCRFCEVGLSKEHFRACPHCAESIRKEATLCRFCFAPLSEPLFGIESTIDKRLADNSTLRSSNSSQITLAESIRKKMSEQTTYGARVRAQVFEIIVRQALVGAPWKEICAVPMQINNISTEEIEAEVERRAKNINPELPRTSVGDLCAIAPANLLQTLAMSGKTGILIAERQNKVFRAFFQEGRLTHAVLDKLKGIHAIFELTSNWNEGYFYFKGDKELDEIDCQWGIDKPLDRILLECAIWEDLTIKIAKSLTAGFDTILERVENFDEIWQDISSQSLTYIDGTVVTDEDKNEIASISLLFTGFHNSVKHIIDMADYWSSFQILRVIHLLIGKGLLKSTGAV